MVYRTCILLAASFSAQAEIHIEGGFNSFTFGRGLASSAKLYKSLTQAKTIVIEDHLVVADSLTVNGVNVLTAATQALDVANSALPKTSVSSSVTSTSTTKAASSSAVKQA